MQNSDSAPVNPEVKPPRQRRLRLVILIALAVVLVIAFAVGESCGASWERSLWEPKYADLDNKYTELQELNTDLNAEIARLSGDNLRYLDQYQEYLGIGSEVNRRLGNSCEDRRSFITPADAKVAVKVSVIAGGYSSDANERWLDYERMYEWVRTNIKYSSDSRVPQLPPVPDLSLLSWRQEYWRTPSETLEDATGDCEDMAILLASMIRNYTQSRYACWVIAWSSQTSGHAAVAIPVEGGNLVILDPAGNRTIGSGGYKTISVTTSEWLGLWPSESGIYVSAIFSDTECESFANTSEFLTWASARA